MIIGVAGVLSILSVKAADTLTITTTSLSSGTTGVAYTSSLSANGGSADYVWSATGLPGGLSADNLICLISPCQGPSRIYGTPTTAGTYAVNVILTSGTQNVSKQLSLVINPSTISTPTPTPTPTPVCAQVITPAQNSTTGECRNFSTPCDVPAGWTSVNSCPVVTKTPTPTPTPVPSECLPDNTLVKMPDDPKVYVIINCQKKWIQSAEKFKEEGYKWTDIKEVNSPVIQAYTNYLQATTNLLKAIGQERVYKVVNNKLLWVPTISAFNAQGLKWSDVQSVDTTQLNQYQRAKLLQINGDQKIYYITESGLKKHILNESVFNSYNNKWEDVVTVDAAVINSYPDANLIKAEDGYQVYKLENGQKRWIKTDAAFKKLKLDWNKVVPVNSTELAAYPDGAAIE